MKKAQYFSFDAIIATLIMLIGLLLALSIHVKEPETASVEQYSQDVMNIISSVKLNELNNSYILELYNSGVIDDLNKTLLEQAAFFWAENQTELAKMLLNITQELIPAHIRLGIFMGDELVFGNGYAGQPSPLISSKRLISGIEKGKPIEGYSSIVQLASFEWRSSYSYYYFGGFVGQGNLTVPVIIPEDVVNITSAYMELDANNNFTLYINGNETGFYAKGSGGGSYMRADKWTLDSGNYSYFNPGINYVSFRFSDVMSYVGGGFFRVGFSTSEVNETTVVFTGNNAIQRYYFPGIKGLPNLYDSFFVPGQLQTMKVHLHYNNNLSTFLTIGNSSVWSLDADGEQFIDLSNSYLDQRLDYQQMSQNTIPLRFGSVSGNESAPSIGGGSADVVLATDLSGTMEFCAQTSCTYVELSNENYCNAKQYAPRVGVSCNRTTEDYNLPDGGFVCSARWHANCSMNDKRKIDVAINASKIFSTVLLGSTGNRLGMVGYTGTKDDRDTGGGSWPTDVYPSPAGSPKLDPFPNNIVGYANLTSNLNSITNFINTYMDSYWGTCIGCGVHRAMGILTNQSSAGRYKTIIVMSDGQATDKRGSGVSNPQQASNDSIDAAREACALNISVSTVAFGNEISALGITTLKAMASICGKFYNASNISALTDVYEGIADEINTISYSEQVANLSGGGVAEGTLFGDSYIEYNYTLNITTYGMIPAVLETPRFGNDVSEYTFNLLAGKVLSEARITSYSAEKWTDNLTISNSILNRKAFSLKDIASNYSSIGDPFVVYANPSLFEVGDNLLHISTGTTLGNYSGGSSDDMMIYKILIPNIAGEEGVFPTADGCTWWNLTFEDGTSTMIKVPSDYSGGDNCSYNPPSYDVNDAVDSAVYKLLSRLDLDGDGLLDVKFTAESIDIKTFTITNVPSLWGPALTEVRAWQ
ncbi:MAG: vWA domain-containing protein [Candidatus Woesearchaeota archaeon]